MPKLESLINRRYGRLTVIEQAQSKNDKRYWKCQCDCGNITFVSTADLNKGNTKSCGCLREEMKKLGNRTSNHTKNGGRKPENLLNKKFGKLTAIEMTPERKNGSVIWKCQCDCGNIYYTSSANLKNNLTQSCGCIKSIGESNISLLLQQNNINFIREYNVKINNNNRRFDFAIIENNQIIRLIEFDGPQHDENNVSGYFKNTYEDLHKRDLEKNQWAKEQNIPLVRIPYKIKNNITLSDLLENKYLV